ncbi:hypothetical protein GCM10010492_58150 [Saccharothrix mutabilis subsp. mutabilis]|uniref:PASTA domain-containing protein n=1 Tax=Saccharothrix mutabilis subsp. mutabilis TaxID=66855 RepID=A0ABN0UH38_9PSEU
MSEKETRDARQLAQQAAEHTQTTVVRVAAGLLALVFLVSVSLALSLPTGVPGGRVGIGVTVFLLFCASLLAGGSLGFLFGLPRSRFAEKVLDKDDGGESSGKLSTGSRYVANSNLVKVSDWLTTVVVGLTLVNLGQAVPTFRDFASALREPLGGAPWAGALGLSVVVLGVLAGMLLVYLWVSIRGRALLEQADLRLEEVPELTGKTVEDARETVSALSLKLHVEPKEAKGDWKVVNQRIDPGTCVNESTVIEVTAAPAGPAPTRSTSPDGGQVTATTAELVIYKS